MKIAVVILLLSACNTGNNFVAEEQPDLTTGGVLVLPDLSSPPSDLAIPGPSCGQVAMCVLGCGQDPTCLGGCVTGVDPQTFASLGSLLLCAGTSCLSGLGGGGDGGLAGGLGNIDTTQLFLCLAQSCAAQLSMCGGLFGGL